MFPFTPTLLTLTPFPTMEPLTSSQPESPVHLSPDKDKDSPQLTTATDSMISCELLQDADPDGSSLKTSPDSWMHPSNLEPAEVHSLQTYSGSFPKSGMWGSGWFSVQPSLDCPTIEKDCLSLPTPTALSSRTSRPPGQNKLEVKLKQLGLIQRGEVANPELLETMFGLPRGYSSPVVLARETASPADGVKHSEIPSASKQRSQPSSGYSTSTPFAKSVKELSGKYSSKSKGKKSKSSDCWYTPPHIVELVIQVLGQIDLDPCADDGKHIPALFHYTAIDDGLEREWKERVFMNPPYSCPGKWMSKLQAEVEA